MTDLITVHLRRELPNGEEFNYRYQIPAFTAEKLGDVEWSLMYHYSLFMAEYAKVKDNLEKEIL